jgi:hypothetical protein
MVEYSIGKAQKVTRGPWRRGNPIKEIGAYGRTKHPTGFDLRVSNHTLFDSSIRPDMDGGRIAAVFNTETGEPNGPGIRVPGILRWSAVRWARTLIEQDINGTPRMPYS